MNKPNNEPRTKGNPPAVYRIVVEGQLGPKWYGRLSGMEIIRIVKGGSGKPSTILEGFIRDQSELHGILHTLFELRVPLLSVEVLDDEQTKSN
jgi:hypothetical protein